MPDYRCECVGADGQAVVRVMSAESAEAAARAALAEGLKVVRVQRMAPPTVQTAPDFSPVPKRRSSPDSGRVAVDFFRFRILWTPPLTQLLFALATLGCVLGMVLTPLSYSEELRQHADRVSSQRETVKKLEAYIPRASELEELAQAADQEARQHEGRADFRIAHAKAIDKADALRKQAKVLSPVGEVATVAQAESRVQALKQSIRAHMAAGPSPWTMLRDFGMILLSWIGLRLLLEFIVILFSIHDRLVELSDAARKSAGAA